MHIHNFTLNESKLTAKFLKMYFYHTLGLVLSMQQVFEYQMVTIEYIDDMNLLEKVQQKFIKRFHGFDNHTYWEGLDKPR